MNNKSAALTATAVATLLTVSAAGTAVAGNAHHPTPKADYDYVSMQKFGSHYDSQFMNGSGIKIKKDMGVHTVTIKFQKKSDGLARVTYKFHAPAGMKLAHDGLEVDHEATGSAAPENGSDPDAKGHFILYDVTRTSHSTDVEVTAGVDTYGGKGTLTVHSVKVELVPTDFVDDGAAR